MNRRGYSMVELLLSVALIGILTGITAPIYFSYQTSNALDVATYDVVQAMRRAQGLSQGMEGDATWGVYVQSGSVTIFQGADYATRDTDFDEVIEISGSITPSGSSEVVFDKSTGLPDATASITLTSSSSEVKTITLNEKGIVDY